MQLQFIYDLEKDTQNFLKSFSSVNDKNPTKLQELYTKEIGELEATKVSAFLEGQGIDIPQKKSEIEEKWKKIEPEVMERMEKLFSLSLKNLPIAYLSTNSRCTYSISDNYFFVYLNGKNTNGTIAHELLHFYTWHAFHSKLEKKDVSKETYNDIKEALTELLNTDFQDLLPGYTDKGYPQHQKMRARIRQMREHGRGIKEIVTTP